MNMMDIFVQEVTALVYLKLLPPYTVNLSWGCYLLYLRLDKAELFHVPAFFQILAVFLPSVKVRMQRAEYTEVLWNGGIGP